MPESPPSKHRPHPWRRPDTARASSRGRASVAYAELSVATNFTFLTGASHPEELVERAAELDHRAIAITDRNSLAGVVRAHVAAKEAGLALAIGCRLDLEGEASVLVYPTDVASYGRLSRLLTLGKLRVPKGECRIAIDDLVEYQEGLLAVALPLADDRVEEDELALLRRLSEAFDDDRLSAAAAAPFGDRDRASLEYRASLARRAGIPLVATNDVHYHVPSRRPLQDVLTCIRLGRTLESGGLELFSNAERNLKSPAEMARLFADHPRALDRSVEVAERSSAFGLDDLVYSYPDEVRDPGRTPMEELRALTERGTTERYPDGLPDGVRGRIEHELALVDELGYAPYFLTVADIVDFARSKGILCQGRGAAANSAVCYCLGVTSVDPDRIDLLFERFVSKERDEPPDIDIDFEHERREEVLQYVYSKYGRDRASMTAEVITYRSRSAVREVGKALGLSSDCIDMIAKEVGHWDDTSELGSRLAELEIDSTDRTMRWLLRLTSELIGFPRHLSQHVGGFVITKGLLSELVPIGNAAMPDRTMIEWDKDDLDAMGILKVDLLGLGMLTCLRKSFDLIRGIEGEDGPSAPPSFALHTIPPEDPAVYDMICAADTVGVFQIESRAQMSMLPRLRPREFYDLVIEVAIVRPGPIQGDMVHPYLRRRNGEEPIEYPDEGVRRILSRTLGVPIFQEQAMSLAIVAAGFTPTEADRLRRAMASWKRKGDVLEALGRKLERGFLANGYSRDFADRFLKQIKGFSEYGFPESHAASFALLVYVSSWLKRHYPAAFAAALVNSQPMGFYAPAQIVKDAEEHGVEVRPVDVNHSTWDCTLERGGGIRTRWRGPALRLGMRLITGLSETDADAISDAVARHGPFQDVETLQRESGARVGALRKLAYADAFGSFGLVREKALWQVRALRNRAPAELPFEPAGSSSASRLPVASPLSRVLHDYAATRLSLKAHPISFLRERFDRIGVSGAVDLRDAERFPHGRRAKVAGLVLVRQRPGTASGIVFVTLEDETGIANLIVRPAIFERFRRAARHSAILLAEGKVERQGEVVHLLTDRLEALDGLLPQMASRSRDFH